MNNIAKKFNNKIYYGWVIVIISAISLFFSSPGQTYSISVFNSIYEQELGFTKTMLSTGYSIATTISGFVIIFMGRAIDKHGARKMYIIVTVMLALASLFSSFVTSIYMIYISFFLLRFFGQGSMTLIPNSLVPQWFDKKRAFAISIMVLGSFLGTLFVPRINLYLISLFDWQNAWRIWSISLMVIMLPLVLIFIFNKPEDLAFDMENEKTDLSKEDQINIMNLESFTLKEAIKTKEFWIIGLISMIVPMFTTGVTFHFFSIMTDKNVTNESAAWIIGLIAFPIIIMPFIARLFIDKVKPKYIFIITQLMIILSMLLLMVFVKNEITALIFILFYGFQAAIQSITLGVIWPKYYGRKYLGSIRGFAIMFGVIGSALGPLPFGISYDLFNTFNVAIIIMMVFTTLTLLLSFLISKPIKKVII
jgi:MFS family permease